MSRLFDDAASDKAEIDVAAQSGAPPLTLAMWDNPDDDADRIRVLVSLGDKDVSQEHFALQYEKFGGGSPLHTARQRNAAGIDNSNSSAAWSTGVWKHTAGRFTSNTSRTLYVNGVAGTPNTDTRTNIAADRTSVGTYARSIDVNHLGGQGSWASIWNGDVSAVMVAALSRGASPFAMRPDIRVFLAPLDGLESPEPDYDGQNNLTLTGTVKGASNPPVELMENYL